jgi:hypothetical protein
MDILISGSFRIPSTLHAPDLRTATCSASTLASTGRSGVGLFLPDNCVQLWQIKHQIRNVICNKGNLQNQSMSTRF